MQSNSVQPYAQMALRFVCKSPHNVCKPNPRGSRRMNVTEQQAAAPEAHAAAHSWIISDLRNGTALGRLNLAEIRDVLARLETHGYAITKVASTAAAKAQHAALPGAKPAIP